MITTVTRFPSLDKTEYSCEPQKAVVCAYEQVVKRNMNTCNYDLSKAILLGNTWFCGEGGDTFCAPAIPFTTEQIEEADKFNRFHNDRMAGLHKATEYTVVYRMGGTERCVWHKAIPGTLEECLKMKGDTERMGYKCLLFKTKHLNSIGMPEGWDWKDISKECQPKTDGGVQ